MNVIRQLILLVVILLIMEFVIIILVHFLVVVNLILGLILMDVPVPLSKIVLQLLQLFVLDYIDLHVHLMIYVQLVYLAGKDQPLVIQHAQM